MENNSSTHYTPDISDIYFGFEFEVLNSADHFFFEAADGWHRGDNAPYFSPLRHVPTLIALINQSLIRVKYLDKEDIENLGWKHDYNDDGEESPNLFDEHGYSLGFSIDKQDTELNTAWLLHYFPDDHYLIIDSIVNSRSGRENMLFRGYVKNKSELKKIMQQVNIMANGK